MDDPNVIFPAWGKYPVSSPFRLRSAPEAGSSFQASPMGTHVLIMKCSKPGNFLGYVTGILC
jgi:hypothetical protein